MKLLSFEKKQNNKFTEKPVFSLINLYMHVHCVLTL